ncbi:MAG: TauD/TfdA family dioxygenase, partial [Alphaproteobacteria bacterium]|nr:TauD/TfdA family dioxygenase [Alphaproteobacteria bacterium]
LEDIAAALAGVKGRGLALTDIAAEDFPLPSMAGQLAAVKALLGDGPGVALLRGLPVDRYGRDDLGLILGGIGAHLGTNVPQSADGDMIVDVMDMSHTGDASRAYRSPRPQGLHCDSVDATGLLCLRRAKTGGTSLITSSLAVYNAILSERPELMAPLCVGYHYRRSGQTSTGEPALSSRRIPVFGRSGGRLVCYFNPDPIVRALAEDGIENDPLALEAFEQFNATAAREDLLYRTMLEPGDLQFFNNRTVMHGRTAFEDFDEVARKRLMLRLWLRMPDWPDPPKDMILQRDRKTPKTAGAPV